MATETGPALTTSPHARPGARLGLARFSPTFANLVAGWVQDEAELFWLAPSVVPPLTGEKVMSWTRVGGDPLLLVEEPGAPVGYAELNPMRESPSHLWIGHLIVDPARRGRGWGEAFTRLLLDHAFTVQRTRLVSLIVFPENRAAIRCYLRAGFEVQDEQFHTFGRSSRRYRMLHLIARTIAR